MVLIVTEFCSLGLVITMMMTRIMMAKTMMKRMRRMRMTMRI